MQWMSNSSLWQIAMIGGLLVAIALVVAVIYRVAFGHRLRVPGGGRARQPRLGLVDAFSLDGQRQLVLVRRDNVEHLIMIGGPNDVLVESQIVRAAVSPAARERDAAAVKALPIAPVHAVGDAPVHAVGDAPVHAVGDAPIHALGGAPAVAIEAPPQPAEPAPPPPPPRIAPRFEAPTVKPAERVAPAPLRPAIRAVAAANGEAGLEIAPAKPVAPVAPVAPAKPVAPVAPVAPVKPVAPAPARPPAQARPPLPPPIVVAPTARTRATPVVPPAPEAPAAAPQAVARPPSPETPAPAVKPPAKDAFGDLESLEAEMARLLGRDV